MILIGDISFTRKLLEDIVLLVYAHDVRLVGDVSRYG